MMYMSLDDPATIVNTELMLLLTLMIGVMKIRAAEIRIAALGIPFLETLPKCLFMNPSLRPSVASW